MPSKYDVKRRIENLEAQKDQAERQVPVEEIEPEATPEEIARWWAGFWNWPRAAETAGTTESQAIGQWSDEVGYTEYQSELSRLQTIAQDICQEANEPEMELAYDGPEYLKEAEPKYKRDKRRYQNVMASRHDPRRRRPVGKDSVVRPE